MIAEAIQQVRDDAERNQRLRSLDITNGKTTLYDQRGNVLPVNHPIPHRDHTVCTIDSFGDALHRYARSASSVWVSLKRVVAVIDDADESHRVDKVSLPISPSDCFGTLARQQWCSQEKLIDTLRHDLAGATVTPQNTLSVLRNLRFSSQSEQTGKFTNTSAAMGKSVASQVTGEADIPETVSFEFHPFPALSDEVEGAEVVVYCTLFTKPGDGRLWMSPRPGELEAAETKATEHLTKSIGAVAGDIPVFVGTP